MPTLRRCPAAFRWSSAIKLALLTGLYIVLAGGCSPLNVASPPPDAAAADIGTGTLIDPPKPLQDFELTSHTGDPLALSDLRGRPVLLFFGYTNCPDVCPTTMAEWQRVKQSLGDSSDVAFVFVSVDGERDKPDVVARFVGRFDPEFIGLTGDEEAIRAAGKDFGLYAKSHEHEHGSTSYLVDHSPPSYLIDREGRLHKIYSYGMAPSVIAADLRDI